MAKNKENRGGKRAGTGPKHIGSQTSEEFKIALMKAINEVGEELGTDPYRKFAEMLLKDNTSSNVRAQLFRTLTETMVVKKSEIEIEDRRKVVVLPTVQPKPQEFVDKEEEFKKDLKKAGITH